MDRHGLLDRVSQLDLSNLRVEARGQPMHVAALIILEGQPDLDVLQGIVERRLGQAPRLRQVLYRPPPGLGPPVWVANEDFDVRRHVRAQPVPEPGDEASLLRACAELNQDPLDRSRPLWQMWLLTGLAEDRCGLLIRLHHVVADGIASLGMLGALFDPDPGTQACDPPPRAPQPVPRVTALAADQLRRQKLLLRALAVRLSHPRAMVARLAVATARRKTLPPYQPGGRLAQRWMAAVMSRQRLVNVLVSNLPGSGAPLRLGGARVLEMFQIGVVQGNLTVSVGALSYAGQLNLGIAADVAAVSDAEVFAAGISDTLGILGVRQMPTGERSWR